MVAEQRQALAVGSSTAKSLVTVAGQQAPLLNYHLLRYHKGQIDLTRIGTMLAPAKVLAASLENATGRLDSVRSPWLVGPVRASLVTFDQKLDQAEASARLAITAIPVLPGLLGADGPQHYFVAFVSPSEARGLDGIIGAYGELTASDGHISLVASGPDQSLDSALPSDGGALTGLSEYLARYGGFDPGRYFQDVTFSPDFPTVANVIAQLYPQAGGEHIDGVLMIDPYALARLLSITGPVKVPGLPEPLSSANAADVLLKDQYLSEAVTNAANQATRHDFLQNALHVTFQRLVNGTLPAPKALARALDPAVRAGRIALWSANRADLPLIDALHLGDAFPQADGEDLVSVSAQNAGANKIDAYLHQSIVDRVLENPTTGAVSATVTVSLRNDAPSSGLPPIVIDSPSAPGTPTGANYDWLSIYTPFTLRGISTEGAISPVSSGRELGVKVYSGWVLVPPQSTLTVAFSLSGSVFPGPAYELHVRLQPSVNPVKFQARVSSTDGHGARGPEMTWIAGTGVDQVHVFATG
ncbi:MAG: DUF4012 domain-containing protein [Acidimicrobiales bacterium]